MPKKVSVRDVPLGDDRLQKRSFEPRFIDHRERCFRCQRGGVNLGAKPN